MCKHMGKHPVDWFIFVVDKFVLVSVFNHISKPVLMLTYYKQIQIDLLCFFVLYELG